MGSESESQIERNQSADEKSRRRKEARDRMMATKNIEKGLLIVHTGKGKGKSTAAFGMVMRAIGHGMKVGIVQFIKGAWNTGERTLLERFPDLCEIKALGEGFTWETQDRARDIRLAEAAWAEAKRMLGDSSFSLVLLDELNIALRYEYISVDDVVDTLKSRRPDLHVIVTGRNAPEALIEAVNALMRGERYVDAQTAQALAVAQGEGEASPADLLSEREFSVFIQLARGMSVAQIAEALSLSPSTVGTHLYHVKQKLGASNQSELTLVALRWGLIQA